MCYCFLLVLILCRRTAATTADSKQLPAQGALHRAHARALQTTRGSWIHIHTHEHVQVFNRKSACSDVTTLPFWAAIIRNLIKISTDNNKRQRLWVCNSFPLKSLTNTPPPTNKHFHCHLPDYSTDFLYFRRLLGEVNKLIAASERLRYEFHTGLW